MRNVRMLVLGILASMVSPAAVHSARPADRILRAEIIVPAPVAEVYGAWTTDEGIVTFLAPKGHVDLRVDGTYDVWFFPERPAGRRGAEGMRILDVEPPHRFVFTWDAPPNLAKIRSKRTIVVLDFEPAGEKATKLRFTQSGWGDGVEWDKAYDYFDRAWSATVLPRLKHRFEKGPLDWNALPELEPVATTIKTTLTQGGGGARDDSPRPGAPCPAHIAW